MKVRVLSSMTTFIVAALLMQACQRKLSPQESCNFVQTSQQQRVSWKGKIPVQLAIHASVPTNAYAAIDRAVAEYNATLGRGREVIQIVARGVAGPVAPAKDGVSMIYWFTTWEADKPTEQARTTIYWTGTQIFEADVRLNASRFTMYMGDSIPFSNLDLTSLLVHELGHVLGLAHNATYGSVMNFSLHDGQDRRKLSDFDLASLHCEY